MSVEANVDEKGVPRGYPFRPEYEIAPRDAAERIKSGECIVLDCRTEAEWDVARIDGAVLIPLHELDLRFDELEADEQTEVLTLCHHGRRSLTAAMLLQNKGLARARSIVGGLELWSQHIDPAIPRYVKDGGDVKVVS
ncbi:MAG: rhodanese-like domain-containing protein [Phycisphaeraceae bacterium]|nr:rhodanese-like domain-containing protein [Phycisphaeraceae bacterium]MCW5754972.1 rhodanese-like domain-containing protein [Phycisphaeraceae bacterium]